MREDAITLFAFGSAAEQDWFRLLGSVQGVGGRVALAILSVLVRGTSPAPLRLATRRWWRARTASGRKLALRIVNELKDKAGGLALAAAAARRRAKGSAAADALSALANLGFKPAEASAAVAAAEEELGPGATLDALVRLAAPQGGALGQLLYFSPISARRWPRSPAASPCWAWLRLDRSMWWIAPGIGSLCLFAWLLTLAAGGSGGPRLCGLWRHLHRLGGRLAPWLAEGVQPIAGT